MEFKGVDVQVATVCKLTVKEQSLRQNTGTATYITVCGERKVTEGVALVGGKIGFSNAFAMFLTRVWTDTDFMKKKKITRFTLLN